MPAGDLQLGAEQVHLGGCQNYGPFVLYGTWYLGDPKGDHKVDHPSGGEQQQAVARFR